MNRVYCPFIYGKEWSLEVSVVLIQINDKNFFLIHDLENGSGAALQSWKNLKMFCKGISLKTEILKWSHLTCRTILHFSEYGTSHEHIYAQVITII